MIDNKLREVIISLPYIIFHIPIIAPGMYRYDVIYDVINT